MNKIKTLTLALTITLLTACSGGGGGSSSPSTGDNVNGPTGSATIQFGNTSTLSCVGYSVPTDSTSCSDSGGTWLTDPTVLSNAGSCSSEGVVQNGNNLDITTCSRGTLVPVCNVSGKVFGLIVAKSEEARDVCSSMGGSVSFSCPISNSSDCGVVGGTWTARAAFCAAPFPNNTYYNKCGAHGGKVEMSITSMVGSSAIVSGKNVVDVSMHSAWGPTPLNDESNPPTLNPKKLNAFFVIARNGINTWATIIPMNVTKGFVNDPTAQTGTLDVSSPFAEVDNGQDVIRVQTIYSVSDYL